MRARCTSKSTISAASATATTQPTMMPIRAPVDRPPHVWVMETVALRAELEVERTGAPSWTQSAPAKMGTAVVLLNAPEIEPNCAITNESVALGLVSTTKVSNALGCTENTPVVTIRDPVVMFREPLTITEEAVTTTPGPRISVPATATAPVMVVLNE
jgi:hypothetical protein